MTTTDSAPPPADDIEFVAEQIEAEDNTRDRTDRRRQRADTLRPLLWRLHFLGGFLAAPIIVMLCVSGILYAWHPQLDSVRFGSIINESSSQVSVSLADQVSAAQKAYPDWTVFTVQPGGDGLNTKVTMDPPGGSVSFGSPTDAKFVYVDQATGKAMGVVDTTETSDTWTRTLHSSLRLGPNFEPFTELAGAWFLTGLLTGLYLWWPGLKKRGTIAFAARRGLKGRRKSKEWHNFIGVTLFVPMVFLALTGLVWTQFSGDRMDPVSKAFSQPAGAAESTLPAPAPGNADLANIDRVYEQARAAQLVEPVAISLPADDESGWNVTSLDLTFPVEKDQIVVNGATGEVTSTFEYRDEHWFNKLSTAGTLFHQAQLFGVALQLFMTALALCIIAMVWYGYKMWWQRRPSGGMGTPPPIRDWVRNAPISILVATAVLAWLMPMLGLSLVVWLVLEAGWRWLQIARGRQPAAPSRSVNRPATATGGAR